MAPLNIVNLLVALLSGVLPALLWVLFWMEEDRLHPEPRRYVIIAFLGGIALIPIALILEVSSTYIFASDTLPSFVLWATIEEIGKFLVAYLIAKRIKLDEPVDAIMYIITVALGFASIENTIFILAAIKHGSLLSALITDNVRFLGSTLLHIVGSGIIGAAWALGLSRKPSIARTILVSGVILSIGLHTAFNFFILNASGLMAFLAFGAVWVLIIALLLTIEKIKHLQKSPSIIKK